jgi:hypothetical protein
LLQEKGPLLRGTTKLISSVLHGYIATDIAREISEDGGLSTEFPAK